METKEKKMKQRDEAMKHILDYFVTINFESVSSEELLCAVVNDQFGKKRIADALGELRHMEMLKKDRVNHQTIWSFSEKPILK